MNIYVRCFSVKRSSRAYFADDKSNERTRMIIICSFHRRKTLRIIYTSSTPVDQYQLSQYQEATKKNFFRVMYNCNRMYTNKKDFNG